MDAALMNALIAGCGFAAGIIIMVILWLVRTPDTDAPEGHVTIGLIRGRRGRWRFTVRNEQGQVIAVANPHGYDTATQAREQATWLCVSGWRVSYADTVDHTQTQKQEVVQ